MRSIAPPQNENSTADAHTRLQRLVALYHEVSASRAESREALAHLAVCDECAAAHVADMALETQLRTYLDAQPPLIPDLRESVTAYTTERARQTTHTRRLLRRVGALASLAVLVGGFVAASVWIATGTTPFAAQNVADDGNVGDSIARYTPTSDSAEARAAVARFTAIAQTGQPADDRTDPPQPTPISRAFDAPAAHSRATGVAATPDLSHAAASPQVPVARPTQGRDTHPATSSQQHPPRDNDGTDAPPAHVPVRAGFVPNIPGLAPNHSPICIASGTSPDGRSAAAVFGGGTSGYLPVIYDAATAFPRLALPILSPGALRLSPDTQGSTCGRGRAVWLDLHTIAFLHYADDGTMALVSIDTRTGTATAHLTGSGTSEPAP